MSRTTRSLELDSQSLWEKYEEIAMHFNDLLMRIRMQSLAGIAALSTIVSLFGGQASSNPAVNWMIASGLFGAMLLIWVAIFCLDYFYYSRLLGGAVAAILLLEKHTKQGIEIDHIDLSLKVEEQVKNGGGQKPPMGVQLFYGVVFVFIFLASAICMRMTYLESEHYGLISGGKQQQEAKPPPPPDPS